MSDPELAQYRADGQVRVITMNMPGRLNAMSIDLMGQVTRCFEEFLADDGAEVAILTGAGRGFCSGWDRREAAAIMSIEDAGERTQRQLEWRQAQDRFNEIVQRRDGPKPVITAINGLAIGGGLGIAMAGLLRIAVESAYFQEVTVQIGTGLAGHVHSPAPPEEGNLAEILGLPDAILVELALGLRVSAARAYQVGMVNRLVPDSELMSAAMHYAGYLCELPRTALHQALAALQAHRIVRRPQLAGSLDSGGIAGLERTFSAEALGSARAFTEVRDAARCRRPRGWLA
jgi:enoyl-CoA hydratase/carnithine racemase